MEKGVRVAALGSNDGSIHSTVVRENAIRLQSRWDCNCESTEGDRLRKQLTGRICKTHPPVVQEALQAVRINRGQQNNQTHQVEEAVAE